MLGFSDIIKSSILAEISAISAVEMLIAIGLAFALSLLIVLIYRFTYAGVSFSRNFALCLIMISMVTALVIQVITSNVVLSLGMVGALSIVRFRTAVKEPADTAFLFWAIATGIICGAGYVVISILATLALGLLFVAIHFLSGKVKADTYMVVVRSDRDFDVSQEMSRFPGYRLKNKTVTNDMAELVAEARLSSEDMKKLTDLQATTGIREISIMQSVSGSIL